VVLLPKKGISKFVSSRISQENEIPCATIESQVEEKVSCDHDEKCLEIQGAGTRGIQRVNCTGGQRTRTMSWQRSDPRELTAELQPFKPLKRLALVGDDLRLPDQSYGHETHRNNAADKHKTDAGLVSGIAKGA
jgi:hypothetical protein